MKKLILTLALLLSIDRGAFAITQGEIAAAGILTGTPDLRPGNIPVVVRPGVLGNGMSYSNGTLTVGNLYVTNLLSAPGPVYMPDITAEDIVVSNSFTLGGTVITGITQTVTSDTNTVPSNLAAKSYVDARLNPTSGITQATADDRYLWSGVLLESNGVYTSYSTVTGAYAAAVSGNNIKIGKGTHEIGNVYLTKPSIGFYGAGKELTTLHGNLDIYVGSESNVFKNLKIFNDNPAYPDTVVSRLARTNAAYLTMENVDIVASISNLNCHIMELTGDYIDLRNVNTKSLVPVHGHKFVLKGVKNARVIDCSSEGSSWNDLYIKADSRGKGDCSNIFVSGFNGKSGGGYLIQTAGTNSTIDGVTIVSSKGSGSTLLQFDNDNPTSSVIKNVIVDLVGNNLSGSPLILTQAKILNTTVKITGDLVSTNQALIGGLTQQAGSDFSYLIDVASPLGRASIKDYVQTYSTMSPDLSSGTATNHIRAIASTNGTLYVVSTTNSPWYVANLATNDPVSIETGTAAGTYRLTGWGTVTTQDVPVAGAVIGEFYAACSLGALNSNAVFTTSVVRPGKAIAVLNRSTVAGSTTISALIRSATKHVTAGYVSIIDSAQAVLLGSTVTVEAPVETVRFTSLANHKAKMVLFENRAYLCAFGTASASWPNTRCVYAKVSLEMYAEFQNIWIEKVTGLK